MESPTRYWRVRWLRTAVAVFLMFAVLRLASYALANDNGKPTGRLEGTVFVGDHGHQSYSSGAKVLASGPIKIETETTADGKYRFCRAAPGDYTVEATYSGLGRWCRRSLSKPIR